VVGELRIRPYRPSDEESWLRCRVLSFLGSAYFDDVRQEKERYARPAIELVAEDDGEVVGLIDVECEEAPGTVCSERPGLGGMIWHLAVHPDHQRRGIATALLGEAERLGAERGLVRFFPVAEGLRPVKLFAHYIGDDRDEIRRRFARVHDCVLYEQRFGSS
jgi:GNAT superfamily N-acetyltransferase